VTHVAISGVGPWGAEQEQAMSEQELPQQVGQRSMADAIVGGVIGSVLPTAAQIGTAIVQAHIGKIDPPPPPPVDPAPSGGGNG
jgi:hypothetical protein